MSRPSVSPRRRLRLILVGLSVLALGLGAFFANAVLRSSPQRPPAAATTNGATAQSRVRAAATPVIASAAPTVHDVLFVGASYTEGLGATPQTNGYAYVVGRMPGWRSQVDGVAGTGFLNPGPFKQGTFADRIPLLPTTPHPDLIVFQGGRNDVSYPSDQLRAAVLHTADLTHKRFRGAQLVFLGPIPAKVPAPADQVTVERTMRSAAAACHAVFIDPIEQAWITPSNEGGYAGSIPAHPDNEGYAYIAQRLVADLALLYPNNGQV